MKERRGNAPATDGHPLRTRMSVPSAFIRRSPQGHVETKKSPAAACGDGIRRDFTVARPHRPQGFALPPSSPVRTLHGAFSP